MSPMNRLTGGRIGGLYVGNSKGTVNRPVSSLLLTLDGIEGDAHSGRTQRTGAREPAFRRGTTVANTRQLSLVSVEELSDIASRLGIAYIDPAWLAANIATEGAGPITQLPPGTLLRLSSGASIYIAELNSPCRVAARLIAQHVAYNRRCLRLCRAREGPQGCRRLRIRPGNPTSWRRARGAASKAATTQRLTGPLLIRVRISAVSLRRDSASKSK